MKLVILLVASLALSVPLVNGGGPPAFHDHNFFVSYGLSNILDRTGFSRVIGEAFGITGRAKYLRFIPPIEYQLTSMIHESFLQLPADVSWKIIEKFEGMLNTSLPVLEKFDPALVRDLDQRLKADVSILVSKLRWGIRGIDRFVKTGNASSADQKDRLMKLAKFLRYMDREVFSTPAFNQTDKPNLKETLLSLIDVFKKLPKSRSVRRYLCPIVKDRRLHGAMHVLGISRQFFIFNFRGTLKFLQEQTLKHMIKSYLRAPPVKKMMAHFGAVLSNRTVAALTRFYKRNGLMLLKEKMRLMLALTFRPNGTFTQWRDFIPYTRSLVGVIKNLPEKVKKMIPFDEIVKKMNNTDIPALLERMKKPNEVTKMCLGMLKHLPKDLLQKLRARPGFDSDAKSYCSLIESYDRFVKHAPQHMLSILKFAQKEFGIPAEYVTDVKITFAPGNIPFIGYAADNPKAFYKKLLSKGAMHRMLAFVSRSTGLFKFVRHRVQMVSKVMFGQDACKDEAPSGRNSTPGPR